MEARLYMNTSIKVCTIDSNIYTYAAKFLARSHYMYNLPIPTIIGLNLASSSPSQVDELSPSCDSNSRHDTGDL